MTNSTNKWLRLMPGAASNTATSFGDSNIRRFRESVGDAGVPEATMRAAVKDPNAAANFFNAGREARLRMLQQAQDSAIRHWRHNLMQKTAQFAKKSGSCIARERVADAR
jgi:hypothetical protein